MRPSEIAIEEYSALRQETLSHFTSMTTLVSIALTATAAIAGFAFGSKPDDGYRLEIPLALPLVFSGLGFAKLVHTSSVLNIGYYTKTYLWDVLRQSAGNSDEATLRALSFEDLQPDPDDLPARFWPRIWLTELAAGHHRVRRTERRRAAGQHRPRVGAAGHRRAPPRRARLGVAGRGLRGRR